MNVGVIGGADGPTSIFLAGSLSGWVLLIGGGLLLLGVVGGIVLAVVKHNNE